MHKFFKNFGLLAICSILFSTSSLSTTLPPIVLTRQVIMYSSLQETRNSVASRSQLFNCAIITKSLSFSFFAKYACVSASICYVVYWSAICFQSAIPTLSLVPLINQSNCLLDAFKFHVHFKFHASYFIALNSSSPLQAYCHASIHITRTYFRYFFIVCSFYFTSAFGFVFIITPLLSAIPATHLQPRHHHTYSATAIHSPWTHAVFTITSATASSSQEQGHSCIRKTLKERPFMKCRTCINGTPI